jgi:aspartate-semialdehyde dehydrogenase
VKQVGIIGWRGMVGSVLLERMRAERDFDLIEPVFFSTSQAGATSPDVGRKTRPVQDAHDLAALARLPMLISTQGGDYTQAVHGPLRAAGWRGYWIDAASTLRMSDAA